MKKFLAAALIAVLASSTAASAQSSVMGTWLTAAKSAEIRISSCPNPANGPICGTIVKLFVAKGLDGRDVAPEAATDVHNAAASQRSRKILGMVLIHDFKATNDPNAFEDGTIYNAENGKTYKANLGLQSDGTLRVRGYVGSAMFGETQIWTWVQ